MAFRSLGDVVFAPFVRAMVGFVVVAGERKTIRVASRLLIYLRHATVHMNSKIAQIILESNSD